jgi:flagellar hook-basal body complex protein FliE
MPVNLLDATGSAATAPLLDAGGSRIAAPEGERKGVHSFADVLSNALSDVDRLQHKADDAMERLAKGEDIDIHQVMIAMEQASTALQLTLQVRNKMVDAYTEIMRTQI